MPLWQHCSILGLKVNERRRRVGSVVRPGQYVVTHRLQVFERPVKHGVEINRSRLGRGAKWPPMDQPLISRAAGLMLIPEAEERLMSLAALHHHRFRLVFGISNRPKTAADGVRHFHLHPVVNVTHVIAGPGDFFSVGERLGEGAPIGRGEAGPRREWASSQNPRRKGQPRR